MGAKGRPPKRAGGFTTYTWDRCPPKHHGEGYLAGDIHDFECHIGGKTKPCEKELLGENAPCPGCRDGKPIDWCGYVPLRDATGRPVMIIVRYGVYDVVTRIKPGSAVRWGRDDDKFDPVWLLERPNALPWSRWWPEKNPVDDMVPWLCKFWTTPHLEPAIRTYYAKAAALPEPVAPVKHTDKVQPVAKPRWVKGAADALAEKEAGKTFDEVAQSLASKARANLPSGNGKK